MAKRDAYRLDDPTVQDLGRFLEAAPLANGTTTTGLGPEMAALLAQAVANWSRGLVWSGNEWIERATYEQLPEVGDVEVETLADGQVVKMRHRATGITALGESHDQAWAELKKKVVTERDQYGPHRTTHGRD